MPSTTERRTAINPSRPAADGATGTVPASVQLSIWEWEGGLGAPPERTWPAPSAGPHATLLPAAGPGYL